MHPESVFTGHVENDNGELISQCQVSVSWGKGDHISQVLTPADNGVFWFDGLPAATYSITVSFDRQQLYTGNVQLGEGEVVERTLNPRDSGPRRPGG
jgi:hypothetical protein